MRASRSRDGETRGSLERRGRRRSRFKVRSSATADDAFIRLQEAVSGRYSIEKEVGRGGMGIVYLARDIALDRLVAIKLLRPELATYDHFKARFRREARVAARLSHPNIVPIYHVEETGDLIYFVMSYISGETVADMVQRVGPLPLEAAMRWLQEIAWALGYAHAHGVVHRDVKPENILIEQGTGRIVVTDFGIAHTGKGSGVTAVGEVVGTPHFVSPEQATGAPVDARSDIYSLGATAFFMLTGKLLFDAPSDGQILSMQVTRTPDHIAAHRPGVPWGLARIIERCLQKEPADRFPSGDRLAVELDEVRRYEQRVPDEVGTFEVTTMIAGERLAVLLPVTGMLVYALLDVERVGVVLALLLWVAWIALAELIRQPLRVLRSARHILASGIAYHEVRELWRLEDYKTPGRKDGDTDGADSPVIYWTLTAAGVFLFLIFLLASPPWFATASPKLHHWGIAGVLIVAGFFAAAVLSLWSTERTGGWLRRNIWTGSLGASFFRIAGIGLHPAAKQRLPSPGAAEIVLGGAAAAIMRELTSEQREKLTEVPREMWRLERCASELRARRTEIDKALTDVRSISAAVVGRRELTSDPVVSRKRTTRKELLTARREVAEQLENVMARMELIRLELIRIRAGTGSVTGLIQILQDPAPVGQRIDQ